MSFDGLMEGLGSALLLGIVAAMIGAGIVGLIAVRNFRKKWRNFQRDWTLRRLPDGKKAARLAREIRAGARRLRTGLLPAHQDQQEAQELRRMLGRFVDRELPESLDRIISLVSLGGAEKENTLVRRLERQQSTWGEAREGQPRDRLAREVAVTQQLLEQTRQANRSLSRVNAGLAETARALRSLEVEMAALGAVRSVDDQLPARMAETAEDLRHFREAYLALAPGSGKS